MSEQSGGPTAPPTKSTHQNPPGPNPSHPQKTAYGQGGRLGAHRVLARFLAYALVGLGSWLFCFSVVGFPVATARDYAESPVYIDDVRALRVGGGVGGKGFGGDR